MTLNNNLMVRQRLDRRTEDGLEKVLSPPSTADVRTHPYGVFSKFYQTFFDDSTGTQQLQLLFDHWDTYTSTFSGVKNPGYRDQIKTGNDATTPANGRQYNFTPFFYDAYCTVVYNQGANKGKAAGAGCYGYPSYSGLFSFGSSPPPSLVTSVTNRVIRKLLEKAESARSSFESGQDLGELKQTINGVLHPFQSARTYLTSHLNGSMKNLRRVSQAKVFRKVVADSFLEFKFGWDPLARDIKAGLDDLASNSHFNTVPLTASASDTWQLQSPTLTRLNSGGLLNPFVSGRVTGKLTIRYKGGIRTGAINNRIGLLQNLQLDLPHILPTAWDLIPYSWMADYFINIGDIIRAHSFQVFDYTYLCRTTRTELLYQYGFPMPTVSPGATYDSTFVGMNPGSPTFSMVDFSRVRAFPGDLIPSLSFQLPLGSLKPWENMTAILIGFEKEGKRLFNNLRR